MLYRILTEDINQEQVQKIVDSYYQGYTMYKAQGFWKGIKENSLIVEIISEAQNELDNVRALASKIKDYNHQEAVLVETIANHSEFI